MMRSLKPRLLARWAILLLLLAIGSSPEVPFCGSAGPNDIGYLGLTLYYEVPTIKPRVQWSSDGQHIIFTSGGEIYRVASDGSDLQPILESGGPNEVYFSPRISPDGTRIVYVTTSHEVSEQDGYRRNLEIETSRLDGTDRRRLTENAMQDTEPVWSPDGSRIAFMRIGPGGWPPGNAGIYMMAADGSDQKLIFPREQIDFDVFPSLDYWAYWNETAETFVLQQRVPTDSNSIADAPILETDFYYDAGPVWSPDGDKIAFIGRSQLTKYSPDGNEESETSVPMALYVANADGSDVTPALTPSSVGSEYPIRPPINMGAFTYRYKGGPLVWSFDGKTIAFLGYSHPRYHRDPVEAQRVDWIPGFGLYEIGIDGSDLRAIAAIATGEDPDGNLSWSPGDVSSLLSTVAGRSIPNETSGLRSDSLVPRIDAPGLAAAWSPDGSRIVVGSSPSPILVDPPYGGRFTTPRGIDMLYTMAPDGTNIQVIVERDEEGELRAANPPEENCFLFFCWSGD